jgi:hypothetical protein
VAAGGSQQYATCTDAPVTWGVTESPSVQTTSDAS